MSQALSRTAVVAIACGSFIVLLSFGTASSFGLFLQPDEPRSRLGTRGLRAGAGAPEPALGPSQPFIGAIADKWGTARTVVGGGLLYALGVYLMSTTGSPSDLYSPARGPRGLRLLRTLRLVRRRRRCVPVERAARLPRSVLPRRSASARPVPCCRRSARRSSSAYGWQTALALLAFGSIAMVLRPAAAQPPGDLGQGEQSIREALTEARPPSRLSLSHRRLLVCGWRVSLHHGASPGLSQRRGISVELAAWCLALIGLFYVIGSYAVRVLGGRLQGTA